MDPSPDKCNLWSIALEGLAVSPLSGASTDCGSVQRHQAALLLCAASSSLTFIVSSLTGNYSQVDKLWSILPVLYAWIPVVVNGDGSDFDERTLLMAVLASIWGIRLTYNFCRRGGYQWPPWNGDEDYRWSYIQRGDFLPILAKPVAWAVFNLLFISIYQNILLMLITMPSFLVADLASRTECQGVVVPLDLFSLDGVFTVIFISLVVIETWADQQQWKFQLEKARRRSSGSKSKRNYSTTPDDDDYMYAIGFCRSGLFSIVRKPNYAAEQAIWICYYLFTISATGGAHLLNWSISGCLLLAVLFQGSGWFTEMLSERKYPEYGDYKKNVPLYVPSIGRILDAMVGGGRIPKWIGAKDD
mmetsp:Transcript_985/g.2126  ORF Transcript_985/g.2126 Transcript_985/m.2126 type:complete len:359 (+) Transcript_985:59-1135(+)